MGLFDSFKKKTNPVPPNDGPNDFVNEMIAHANAFRDKHEERYDGLDFTVASLSVLDTILEDASDFYEDMEEGQQRNFVTKAGAYIFEVARTNFGGTYFWYDKLEQPILVTGQPEFRMSLLAFEKVKGRLKNGHEDNIPFFFKGYVDGVKNKRSAMIV